MEGWLAAAIGAITAIGALVPLWIYYRGKIEREAAADATEEHRIKELESDSGKIDKLRTELLSVINAKSEKADRTRKEFKNEILGEVKQVHTCINDVNELVLDVDKRMAVLEGQYSNDKEHNSKEHEVLHGRISAVKTTVEAMKDSKHARV